MDDAIYERLWRMLDGAFLEEMQAHSLGDVECAQVVAYAEKIKTQLDDFIAEMIARAKGADEAAARRSEQHQKLFGPRYEAATSVKSKLVPTPKKAARA